MQTKTIPLVGNPTVRMGPATQDQLFTNCMPVIDPNPVTNSANLYLQKRQGTATSSTTGGLNILANYYSTLQNVVYESATNRVYRDGVLIGSVTTNYIIPFISSTLISGIEYVCFVAYDATGVTSEGWYHPSDATVTTFTGDRTSGSPIISSIASTTGLYSGQLISATGFTAAARILTVDSATQVTINENASSGSATSTVVTVTRLAKILDADFPTNARGGFAFLDGFAFINTYTNRIYNSALNSITSWSADNYLTVNVAPDYGEGVYEMDGQIVAFGKKHITFYQNAGNPSGSPLSFTKRHIKVGIKNIGTFAVAKPTKSGIYFLGSSAPGTAAYQVSADGISEISPPSVNASLQGSYQSMVSEVYMFGQTGIVFAYVTINGDTYLPQFFGAYVYWPKSKIWTFFTDPTDGGSDTGMWAIAAFVSASDTTGTTVLGGTGKRFSYTASAIWRDDSAAYSMIVKTVKVDFGTEARKFISKVTLMGADIQASGTTLLEYSDDDYANWTTAGTFDMTQRNPFITRLGSHQAGRAYRLTHSANTAWRAQGLKFDYDVGTS